MPLVPAVGVPARMTMEQYTRAGRWKGRSTRAVIRGITISLRMEEAYRSGRRKVRPRSVEAIWPPMTTMARGGVQVAQEVHRVAHHGGQPQAAEEQHQPYGQADGARVDEGLADRDLLLPAHQDHPVGPLEEVEGDGGHHGEDDRALPQHRLEQGIPIKPLLAYTVLNRSTTRVSSGLERKSRGTREQNTT